MAVDTIARALAIKAQQGGGSGGTSNYQELTNKPSINGVTLEGNKNSADLGLVSSSDYVKSYVLDYYSDLNSEENVNILSSIYADFTSNTPFSAFICKSAEASTLMGTGDGFGTLIACVLDGSEISLGFIGGNVSLDQASNYGVNYFSTRFYTITFNNTKQSATKTNIGLALLAGFPTFLGTGNTTAYTPTLDYHPATKKYVDDLVSTISTLSFQVVTELPTTDIQTNIIYLVPSTTSSGQNIYDEYIYINSTWEKIGSTSVDLSNYLAKDNTTAYTPTGDYNPATKQYVDSSVTNQATTEETISGLKTFTTLPESSVVPTTNNQLVNKAYVDSTLSTTLGNINTILATLTTVSEVTE